MNLLKKREMHLFRRALAVLLTTLLTLNPISPIFTPKEVNAQENSDTKYLSSINITATASSTWDKQYNTEFYKEIIDNYNNYTADKPLQIDSAGKLAAFAKVVNDTTDEAKDKDFSGKYVKLTKDINLMGDETKLSVTKETDSTDSSKFSISITGSASNVWVPIGTEDNPFKGTFDGGNCEVKNMTVLIKQDSDDVYAGLFGYTESGTIQNTGVSGSVYASSSYSHSYIYAGGLVGRNYGNGSTVTNSYATGNVYASSPSSSYSVYVGGLVGHNFSGSVSDSYATGNVYAFSSYPSNVVRAGGLVGYSYSSGSISNSYATGNIYASSYYVYAGGLAGENNKGSISNSYATGNVYASASNEVRAGGLVGYNWDTISNSYATGNVYASSSSKVYAGGLAGYNNSISNSYATGNVYASADSAVYAGGLVGKNYGSSSTVTNSYATCSVDASSSKEVYVGGLVGYSQNGTISNSYATCSVDASSSSKEAYAGGLVGYNNYSSVSNSYAKGFVFVSSYYKAYAGGLVGRNYNGSTVTNSYATGNVYASSPSSSYEAYAGGLVGYNDYSSVSNSYATGSVYASSSPFSSSYAGGLVGKNDGGSITNGYYYSGATIEGATPTALGQALTREQMTGQGEGRATEKMSSLSTDNWFFQDDGIGVKYLPRLNNITYDEKTNPVPKFLVPIDPDASYFEFKEPSDPIVYDGQPKEAKVTSKISEIPNDKITVKYYDDSDKELSGPPTNVGTYTVKINVAQCEGLNKKDGITDETWKFKIEKATPQADDFIYSLPDNLVYDGTAKVATVEPKDGVTGIGPITIKYCKKGSDSWTDTAPTDVGTYTVKIDVARGENYNPLEDITSDKWNFTVSYLSIEESQPYEITGHVFVNGNNYWLKDDALATIKPAQNLSGYMISTDLKGPYNSKLEISSWQSGTQIYLKDSSGHMTDAIKVNVNISQDKNSPTGSITIKGRTPWESLINVITFGLFFKEEQTVTITASDGESGIQEAKYLVSNIDLIQNENVQNEEIKTKLDIQEGWESFTGDPKKDVTLEKDNKYVVYEKITDNVGHVTYISSDGIVVYSDSTTDTSTVSYPKTTKKDIEVKITTNGNTIKDIKIDDSEIDKENYEISAEDEYKKRTITFKGVYLDTLSDGTHILTISYNPQGESYAEGDEPEETQIELFVQTLNIDTDGDGKADINIDTNEDGEADINIDTDGDGKADINIDTDGDGEADINIDTNEDGEADINIDTDGDGKADINIDTNEDGEADFNVDIDGDGEPDINVDKSTWGEKVENSGVTNYVDEKGMTSTEITNFGMIWLREESDGTSAWYGLDNSDGTFKLGSRFWVRWLSKEKDQEEWEYYYDNLDENHKNLVDSGRLWIFLAGVTASNGQEYKEFNKEVKFYIQLGEDWEKDDINAVFISQESDEVVDVEYAENTEYPEGSGEFAKLTLKHFSPYAVYDYLENQEALPSVVENNVNLGDEINIADNDLPVLFRWLVTGDTNTLIILTGLAVVVISSGILILLLKKKRKR